MGYFSNGTEGDIYYSQWCDRCIHMPVDPEDGGCAVWAAHLIYNYDKRNNDASILDMLIPRKMDPKLGHKTNQRCAMFIALCGLREVPK